MALLQHTLRRKYNSEAVRAAVAIEKSQKDKESEFIMFETLDSDLPRPSMGSLRQKLESRQSVLESSRRSYNARSTKIGR
jgi:hypothetical protein